MIGTTLSHFRITAKLGEGQVKLLDFGLAKLLEPTPTAAGGTSDLDSKLQTISRELKLAGKVLGTVAICPPSRRAARPSTIAATFSHSESSSTRWRAGNGHFRATPRSRACMRLSRARPSHSPT